MKIVYQLRNENLIKSVKFRIIKFFNLTNYNFYFGYKNLLRSDLSFLS